MNLAMVPPRVQSLPDSPGAANESSVAEAADRRNRSFSLARHGL